MPSTSSNRLSSSSAPITRANSGSSQSPVGSTGGGTGPAVPVSSSAGKERTKETRSAVEGGRNSTVKGFFMGTRISILVTIQVFAAQCLALQDTAQYLVVHGRDRGSTEPVAPGRTRHLPACRHGRRGGLRLRNDEAARARGLSIVGEGSIYPLLGRLEHDGLVETRRAASNGGPPRKYYSLSPEGERALEAGIGEWQAARDAVDGALGLVKVEVGA